MTDNETPSLAEIRPDLLPEAYDAACELIGQLRARIAELETERATMRGALEKASVLDVGRPIPRDGSERAYVQGVLAGHDQARKYVREIAGAALAEDAGARVLAVEAADAD